MQRCQLLFLDSQSPAEKRLELHLMINMLSQNTDKTGKTLLDQNVLWIAEGLVIMQVNRLPNRRRKQIRKNRLGELHYRHQRYTSLIKTVQLESQCLQSYDVLLEFSGQILKKTSKPGVVNSTEKMKQLHANPLYNNNKGVEVKLIST